MAVRIGSARIDENGKTSGGKAGDSTGKEVSMQDWYKHNPSWTMVLRLKDIEKSKKLAQGMKDSCNNNHIGYDQNQRTTFYSAMKKEYKLDISKISKLKTDCECDCSQLVVTLLHMLGYTKIPLQTTTSTLENNIKKYYPDDFSFYTDKDYLQSSSKLCTGDIVNCKGHHVVVVVSGKDRNENVLKLQKAINLDIKPNPKLDEDNSCGSKTKAQMKKINIKKPLVGANKKYPNITKFVQGKVGADEDGHYGKDTQAKVKTYQKKNGLTVDGVVGYNTLMKMIS
jgi:murein L,D-transpeptidase YcbB/YkuD